MPARAAIAPRAVPAGHVVVTRLPQHEIRRVALVGRHFHAGPGNHVIQRPARQLAIILVGRHIEQHMAFRLIGMALVDERLHHGDHPIHIIRRARLMGGRQCAEARHVLLVDLGGAIGQLTDRDAPLHSASHDLVVDVGDVAHIGDVLHAIGIAQHTENEIERHRRAAIADMRIVINRGSAGIEPHICRVDGLEHPLFAASGVVDGERHVTRHRVRPSRPAGLGAKRLVWDQDFDERPRASVLR